MSLQKLVLFIDGQNFYKGARRAFFPGTAVHHTDGQITPMKMGKLLISKCPDSSNIVLQEVRVYTGRPDATREPITYAAHMKQCAAWNRDGVTVIHRALRYPANWPVEKPQEKGIDVALAIDFVAFGLDKKFDIGVIASTDTDLNPAVEYVYNKCSENCRVNVVTWKSQTANSRLYIKGSKIWCHWLDRYDYESVADVTDYSV